MLPRRNILGDLVSGALGSFFGSDPMFVDHPGPQSASSNRIVLRLRAYSDAFLGQPRDLSGGDKIILHQSVLNDIMNMVGDGNPPYPTIFCLENLQHHRITHCGVLEYSAHENAAFLPLWMMHNLLLSDGQEIKISLCDLNKVSFVKFQPEFWNFTQIPDPKTTLEYALRNFTCLTEGDTILLKYNDQDYPIVVSELRVDGAKPRVPVAGCVIDANVEVDFDPPREAAPEKFFFDLPLNELRNATVEPGQYSYFRVRLAERLPAKFELVTKSGNPDAFISTSIDEPTIVNHTWRLASTGKQDSLVVLPADPHYGLFYYIGVHGYNKSATFEISVQLVSENELQPPVSAMSPTFGKAGHSGHAVGLPASSAVAADPNARLCNNCMQYISAGGYLLHSAQCERNNWRCPECALVVPKRSKDSHGHCAQCHEIVAPIDLEKHVALTHRKVRCECGQEFEPSLLLNHKSESCRLRAVNCKWCNLQIHSSEKADHEEYCGNRSIDCDLCSEQVPRRRMDIHRAAVHKINPCVDRAGNRLRVGAPSPLPAGRPPANSNAHSPIDVDEDPDFLAALSASEDDAEMQAALQASLVAEQSVPSSYSPPVRVNMPSPSVVSAQLASQSRAAAAAQLLCPYCEVFRGAEAALEHHMEVCVLQFAD